jgi:prepilin-type N-terminal cleavage/methylation domain-containing protein
MKIMRKFFLKTKAFTLTEVILTLLIIGVVASLTIPAIINDIQNAELKTAFKKTFAELSQATNLILQENAGDIRGLCPSFDHDCIKNQFINHMSTSKICTTGNAWNNCWHDATHGVKTISGAWDGFSPVSGYTGMILSTGPLVFIYHYSSTCTSTAYSNTILKCSTIYVDVNGFKGPNTKGKDIYYLHLTSNKLIPYGTIGDGNETDCQTDPPSGHGRGCAARFLKGD